MLVRKILETSELSLNLAQRTLRLSPVLMVSKGKLEVLSYLYMGLDPRKSFSHYRSSREVG